jgi:hypothetical protein
MVIMSKPLKPDETYCSWRQIERETIDPQALDSGDKSGAYDAWFATERILYSLQQEVEKEYNHEGNFIAYGILGDEIRPAVVKPSGDEVYVYEEWLNDEAEDMMCTKEFLEGSRAGEPRVAEAIRAGILEGMEIGFSQDVRVGMPEGLRNYAEGVLDRVEGADSHEFKDLNETYVMPEPAADW